MSKYAELKEFFLTETDKARAKYIESNLDEAKLEALQGLANMLTMLNQIETLINTEIVNEAHKVQLGAKSAT